MWKYLKEKWFEWTRPNYYNGKNYLAFESCPFYVKGTKDHNGIDQLERIWFKIFGKYLVTRTTNCTGYSPAMLEAIRKAGFHKVDKFSAVREISKEPRYSSVRLDDNTFLRKEVMKGNVQATDYPEIMYNTRTKKWYCIRGRATMGFGIGDWLFDIDHEQDDDFFWNLPSAVAKYMEKIQWIYKNNLFFHEGDFSDLKELIDGGIKMIIPYNLRGRKIIETEEEAVEAVMNFAKYID